MVRSDHAGQSLTRRAPYLGMNVVNSLKPLVFCRGDVLVSLALENSYYTIISDSTFK